MAPRSRATSAPADQPNDEAEQTLPGTEPDTAPADEPQEAPPVENKAVTTEPQTDDGLVSIELVFHRGDHAPGDVIRVDAALARDLVRTHQAKYPA